MEDMQNSEEEEISLIDLFAVLIRYRIFIVVFTVVTTFLAAFVLFVLPLLQPKTNVKEVTISYSVQSRNLSQPLVENGFPRNLGSSAKAYFSNPWLIARENKKYPIFAEEDNAEKQTDKQYNTFIQQVIKNKKLDVPKLDVSLPNEFIVVLTVREEKTEMALQFFDDMMKEINTAFDEFYRPQLESLKETTEISLASIKANPSSLISDMQRLESLKNAITQELAANEPYVSCPEPPFIEDKAQGRAKKSIIVLFAGFFVAVFLAFAHNAWVNIKADPEASKKLQDAWNAGSRKQH